MGLGEHQQTEQGQHCSQLCPNPLLAEPHPNCSASIEADRVILNLLPITRSTAPFTLPSSFFSPLPSVGLFFSLVGSRQSDEVLYLPRKASSSSESLFVFTVFLQLPSVSEQIPFGTVMFPVPFAEHTQHRAVGRLEVSRDHECPQPGAPRKIITKKVNF